MSRYWFRSDELDVCRCVIICSSNVQTSMNLVNPSRMNIDDIRVNRNTIHAAFSIKNRLQSSLAMLESLTESLRSTTAKFSSTLRPMMFQYGIETLPDELLMRIFEFACDPAKSDHIKLTQVSRRFHQVVHAQHKLWSYISNNRSQKWVEMQLRRSGESGLTIEYTDACCHMRRRATGNDLCDCYLILLPLAKHCHRWYSFTWNHTVQRMYDFSRSTVGSDVRVEQRDAVVNRLRHTSLPALRHLEVWYNTYFDPIDVISPFFCNTWDMPNLRSLSVDEGVRRLHLTSSLVSAKFERKNASAFSTTDLLRFLVSPSLREIKELHIDAKGWLSESGPEIRGKIPDRIEYLRLESICVTVGCSRFTQESFVDDVLSRLLLPNLRRVDIHFAFHRGFAAFQRWLSWMDREEHQFMEKLRITIWNNGSPAAQRNDEQTLDQCMKQSCFNLPLSARRPRVLVRFAAGDTCIFQGTEQFPDSKYRPYY